jgi:hypothetical protein
MDGGRRNSRVSARVTPSLNGTGRPERERGTVGGAGERNQQAVEMDVAGMGPGHPAALQCRDELESVEGASRREETSRAA